MIDLVSSFACVCHAVVVVGFACVPIFTPVTPFFTTVGVILIKHTRNETTKAPGTL